MLVTAPESDTGADLDLRTVRIITADEFVETDPEQLHRAGITTVVAADGELVIQACAQVLANAPHLALKLAIADGEVTRAGLGSVLDQPVQLVDAIEVNGRVCLGALVIDPEVLMPRGAGGAGASRVLAVLRRLWARPSWTTVHVDGVQRGAGRLQTVVVTNTASVRLHGVDTPVIAAPHADETDGQLDVVVLPSGSLVEQLHSIWRSATAQPQQIDLAEAHRGAWVHIRCVRGRPAELDTIALVGGSGDLRVFDIHVLPAAIRLHRPVDPVADSAVAEASN
jgi:hypothetical protein